MIDMSKCRVDEKSDPKFKKRGELRGEHSDFQAVFCPWLLLSSSAL